MAEKSFKYVIVGGGVSAVSFWTFDYIDLIWIEFWFVFFFFFFFLSSCYFWEKFIFLFVIDFEDLNGY